MDENGSHFGHQSGSDYSFLWWIASTKYVNDKISERIESGRSGVINLAANNDATGNIHFNKNFKSPPKVIATVCSETGTWSYSTIALNSISVSGFNYGVHNLENVDRNGYLYVSWIAIGS